MPKQDVGTANRIVCGDALSLIPTLKDRSVNLVLTSPPYSEQRKKQYGGIAEEAYPGWMCRVTAALRPKLTDDGSVLLVIRSNVRNGVVSDYVLRTRLALREDGWCECEELIWLKPDAPPLGSKERPRRTWENILWFSKTPKPFIDLKGSGNFSDRIGFVGSGNYAENGPIAAGRSSNMQLGHARTPDHFTALVSENESDISHPAMFPVSLCEKLIRTFSREQSLVLDPFCGSGSTLVAAQTLGRKFVGFDAKKEYVRLAADRLNTPYSEYIVTIDQGRPVRLRSDFPVTAKSRRTYFKTLDLNVSDAAVFEFILSKTVYSDERHFSAELSHNKIAAATKLSRRTVIRSLERLAGTKLIESLKAKDWHRGNPNRIAISSSLLVPLEMRASDTNAGKRTRAGTRRKGVG